jgi:hypothetical protein
MKTKKVADSQSEPNPLATELAALGLTQDADGQASIRMLTTASTDDFSGKQGEVCSCDPQLAVRLVRRGYAEAYVECSSTE